MRIVIAKDINWGTIEYFLATEYNDIKAGDIIATKHKKKNDSEVNGLAICVSDAFDIDE